MASGHGVPHQQAGHMAAPTSLAPPSKKTLANGEPSTHGTTLTSRANFTTSAYRSKADEPPRALDVRLVPEAVISGPSVVT